MSELLIHGLNSEFNKNFGEVRTLGQRMVTELGQVALVPDDYRNMLVIADMADLPVLMTGLPGTGKSTISERYAVVRGGQHAVLDGTSSFRASRLIGYDKLNPASNEFEWVDGPVFKDTLIINELNRIPEEPQSEFFGILQERVVNTPKGARKLPAGWLGIGSENPKSHASGATVKDSAFTERFGIGLSRDRFTQEERCKLVKGAFKVVSTIASPEFIVEMRDVTNKMPISDAMITKITSITEALYNGIDQGHLETGFMLDGVRADLAIKKAAQARAVLEGHTEVGIEDVAYVAPYAIGHRLPMSREAHKRGLTGLSYASQIIRNVGISGGSL